MTKRIIFAAVAATMLFSAHAYAQTSERAVPPQDGMKLSEIIAKIEARDKFQYIKEIDWDDEGYYQVDYYTTDKAKVEMKLNPVTGEPQ
jgi:hypothetical protein